MIEGRLNIFWSKVRIFLNYLFCCISVFMQPDYRPDRDSRPGNYPRVSNDASVATDVTNRVLWTITKGDYIRPSVVNHHLQRDAEKILAGNDFLGLPIFRINEHDLLVYHKQSCTCPKLICQMA